MKINLDAISNLLRVQAEGHPRVGIAYRSGIRMEINCHHNDKTFEKTDGDWYSNPPFVSRKNRSSNSTYLPYHRESPL